jgi:uncharacterized membrane protein
MTAEQYINQVLDRLPRGTPERAQIARELHSNIDERLARGQSLADILRQLGDPAVLADSYLASVPLVSASFMRRVAAKLIDFVSFLVVVLVPFVVLIRSMWMPGEMVPFAILFCILLASLTFGAYTVVAESWYGKTLGKYLMGFRAPAAGVPGGLCDRRPVRAVHGEEPARVRAVVEDARCAGAERRAGVSRNQPFT